MYAFQHLKNPQNIGSGVAQNLLLAPLAWFAAGGVKEPPAVGVATGDEVTIRENHVFLAGKGFFEMLLAPEMNSLEAKTIGDKGFQKLDQTLRVFVPGSYAEVHECIKNLLNVPFIGLIQDSNCGSNLWYQLGTDCVPAYFTCNFSTGTTKDGKKGYEVELNYTAKSIVLYGANVRRMDGVINRILLGFDDLNDELDYLLGLDDNNLLGWEE